MSRVSRVFLYRLELFQHHQCDEEQFSFREHIMLREISLAMSAGNRYLKREPRHLLLTDTGAGTARLTPPCTVTYSVPFSRSRPSASGRDQLLSGVRRREQDQGHSYKQDENDPHGYCPPYPLAPCRAHGRRATVQERYTVVLYRLQSLSSCVYEEAAIPNDSERGFFHFFSSGDSYRVERGSKGRQPIASRRI